MMARRAGLTEAEVIAIVLYTGPMVAPPPVPLLNPLRRLLPLPPSPLPTPHPATPRVPPLT